MTEKKDDSPREWETGLKTDRLPRRNFIALLTVSATGCLRASQDSNENGEEADSNQNTPTRESATTTPETATQSQSRTKETITPTRTAVSPSRIKVEWSMSIREPDSKYYDGVESLLTTVEDDVLVATTRGIARFEKGSTSVVWRTLKDRTIQNRVASLPDKEDGIVIGDTTGTVSAVGSTNGNVLWETDLGIPYNFTGIPATDQIVVAGAKTDSFPEGGFNIASLDPVSGEINWQVTETDFERNDFLFFEGGMSHLAGDAILVSLANETIVINVNNGSVGNTPFNAIFEPHIAAATDETIYVPRYEILSIDMENTPSISWGFEPFKKPSTSTVVEDDDILFGARDNGIYLLNKNDGTKRWRTNLAAKPQATPVIHNDFIWAGSDKIHLLRRSDGEELANIQSPFMTKIDSIGTSGKGIFATDGNQLCYLVPE